MYDKLFMFDCVIELIVGVMLHIVRPETTFAASVQVYLPYAVEFHKPHSTLQPSSLESIRAKSR